MLTRRNRFSAIFSLLALCCTICSQVRANDAQALRIYLDADRTGSRSSALSIEKGIRTALDEVGMQLAGRAVEIVVRDHRGSTGRSLVHLKEYLDDPNALTVFSGLHSPPLLATRDFINRQKILVLDPWAAAGPITRFPSEENWIFRLSVDDTKAGAVITEHAITEGFERPYLILEDTGWGMSNHNTMTAALDAFGLRPTGLRWFDWDITEAEAQAIRADVAESDADVIFLVANAPEGKTLVRALLDLPDKQRLPVRSHWGITGGDFPEIINAEMRSDLDLAFIQTRFSFVGHPLDDFSLSVFKRLRKLYPDEINTPEDLRAPSGFIHAYDLTRLLIKAVEETGLGSTIEESRDRIRLALEDLQQPVRGLIKTYQKPFGVYSSEYPDAHEALSSDDYCLGIYEDQGHIRLISANKVPWH